MLFFFCTHGWTGHKQCGAKWAVCLIVDELPALFNNFNHIQAKNMMEVAEVQPIHMFCSRVVAGAVRKEKEALSNALPIQVLYRFTAFYTFC